jgi:hypothetical protein
MSKLSDAIKAKAGERTTPPVQRPILPLKVTEDFSKAEITLHRRYTIGVEMYARTELPDHDDRALVAAVEQTKKLITEEMFGEFRKPLYSIKAALLEYDFKKAHEMIDDLIDQMFKV